MMTTPRGPLASGEARRRIGRLAGDLGEEVLSAEQGALFPSSAPSEEAPSRPARILQITPADRATGGGQPGWVDPASAFLTSLEVIARYGWGRTKGYRMLRSDAYGTA